MKLKMRVLKCTKKVDGSMFSWHLNAIKNTTMFSVQPFNVNRRVTNYEQYRKHDDDQNKDDLRDKKVLIWKTIADATIFNIVNRCNIWRQPLRHRPSMHHLWNIMAASIGYNDDCMLGFWSKKLFLSKDFSRRQKQMYL